MKRFTLLLLAFPLACRATGSGPYDPAEATARDTARAQELTHQAVGLVDEDPEQAESLLRDALGADLFYGPAHNNLGVLFLEQSKLYEAANEFEWARKLIPGHPDPRLNLALTLERAGRVQEALETYETALEVAPEHVPTMAALARLFVRSGRTRDERLPAWLDTVALRGESVEWRDWARKQLSLREH